MVEKNDDLTSKKHHCKQANLPPACIRCLVNNEYNNIIRFNIDYYYIYSECLEGEGSIEKQSSKTVYINNPLIPTGTSETFQLNKYISTSNASFKLKIIVYQPLFSSNLGPRLYLSKYVQSS
jgi:hypothetical protein